MVRKDKEMQYQHSNQDQRRVRSIKNTFVGPVFSNRTYFYKKVDINSHKMKELFAVFGLLTIVLTVNAINAQSLGNETSNAGIDSQSRTFTDCYASFYSGMILLQVSEKREIDSESEMKQFFTDTCNFIHDETGKWLDLWKMDELKMLYNQVDMSKFNAQYYPQGVPGSVIDVFSGIGAMAGAVGNGTAINMDDEDFEDDEGSEDSEDGENNEDDENNEE